MRLVQSRYTFDALEDRNIKKLKKESTTADYRKLKRWNLTKP
jgi:hypothetical protein